MNNLLIFLYQERLILNVLVYVYIQKKERQKRLVLQLVTGKQQA